MKKETEIEIEIARLIAIWEMGCSNAHPGRPAECEECTRALIDAIVETITLSLYRKLELKVMDILTDPKYKAFKMVKDFSQPICGNYGVTNETS